VGEAKAHDAAPAAATAPNAMARVVPSSNVMVSELDVAVAWPVLVMEQEKGTEVPVATFVGPASAKERMGRFSTAEADALADFVLPVPSL